MKKKQKRDLGLPEEIVIRWKGHEPSTLKLWKCGTGRFDQEEKRQSLAKRRKATRLLDAIRKALKRR